MAASYQVADGNGVTQYLNATREDLLDLSLRNTLLNYRTLKSRGVDVVDADPAEIYQILIVDRKNMSFEARQDPEDAGDSLVQPEDRPSGELAARHSSRMLQTNVSSPELQKRLLNSYYWARTSLEEQGVSILYLALGMLEWYEDDSSDILHRAPLILIPVELERSNARDRFHVQYTGEDIGENLSLTEKLKSEFALTTPPFPDPDDLDITCYYDTWDTAITGQLRWRINREGIALGFFSFGKFLMYRDLDTDIWPEGHRPEQHAIINVLARNGFHDATPSYADDTHIDKVVKLAEIHQIVDADSSQTLAILEANAGRNLVIQGPPGTGKSQTITNIIAEAIAANKTVLFVSEKMAALEVVKRRLDQVGIGDAALELHSHKTNKRDLLHELQRTLMLGQPQVAQLADDLRQTEDAIRRLNAYCDAVNRPLGSSGVTPYRALGQLACLRDNHPSASWPTIDLPELAQWTEGDFRTREARVEGLEARLQTLGNPQRHPFWGVEKELLVPSEQSRFESQVSDLRRRLSDLLQGAFALAEELDIDHPSVIEDIKRIWTASERVASVPAIPGPNFAADEWDSGTGQIRDILRAGKQLAELHSVHGDIVYERTWRDPQIQTSLEQLSGTLTALLKHSATLISALYLNPSYGDSLQGVRQMIAGARMIADGPDTAGVRVSSQAWLSQTDDIWNLLAKGDELKAIQTELDGLVTNDAWKQDFRSLCTTLENHQTKWWRFLSADYRDAKKTLASYLQGSLPEDIEGQIGLLGVLIEAKRLSQEIAQQADLGQNLFGQHWRARFSNWDQFRTWTEWILPLHREEQLGTIPLGLPQFLDAGHSREQLSNLLDEVKGALINYDHAVSDLWPSLGIEQSSQIRLGDTEASLRHQHDIVTVLCTSYRYASTIGCLADYGKNAFGGLWQDDRSDWDQLEPVVEWTIALHRDIRSGLLPDSLTHLLNRITDAASYGHEANQVAEQLALYRYELDEITQLIEFNPKKQSWESIEHMPLAEHKRLIDEWHSRTSDITQMTTFNMEIAQCSANGLQPIVGLAIHWPEAQQRLSAAFRYARAQALVDRAMRERNALAAFDRATHEQVQDRFRRLDELLLERTRAKIAHLHWERVPHHEGGGQLGILRREFQKKARHLPVRKLVERCGNAIQAIKPVFMMSPMSIATYLPPGSITFDLVIFDEASQVRPADAFGALLRGKQTVVVGDSKQLPPTQFFDIMTQAEDTEEDETATRDMESILGLFTAKNAPERMLRWHYRSQHESLIAVSNYEFYDNRLIVFLSPDGRRGSLGLTVHHLPETSYDRGGSRTNPEEARIVAEAVMRHAQQQSELTLGVAAFSKAQAELILELVDQLRRRNSMAERFFAQHPHEPFFVKNLENVQGDERDVIFISVGYGREASGRLTMTFGPLNSDGGERRLNVLITRARQRCEVFTNLTSDDIDQNRTKARGVVALKQFLKYAETGQLDIPEITGRGMDSPFEEAVFNALSKAGYQIMPQVGSAGFFVDLAVVDPDQPGRYVLGIECDGATYHSARSARDRDRLRQQVLEGLGWTIHRIWSTDWFRNPDRELHRAIEVIERARASKPTSIPSVDSITHTSPEIGRQSNAVETLGELQSAALPVSVVRRKEDSNRAAIDGGADAYQIAHLSVETWGLELHEIPPQQLVPAVVEVVRIESPVHFEEVARRIMDAVGIKRLGRLIRANIQSAVIAAERQGKVKKRGDFLWLPDMGEPPVRDRSNQNGFLGSIEAIAPEEREAAVLRVVAASYGMKRHEAAQAAGKLVGFQRISDNVRSAFDTAVNDLLSGGDIVAQGELLTIAS